LKYIVLILIFILILYTSGYPKYSVQTSQWPPGARWTSYEEINSFKWLNTLKDETKVFLLSPIDDSIIMGYDVYSCSWCIDVVNFRKNIINYYNANELYNFLKGNEYEYMVISGVSIREIGNIYGENITNQYFQNLYSGLQNEARFIPVYQTPSTIIFKID
jgi:hypothetical protein